MTMVTDLAEHLAGLGSALLGYSGGVDSALLAVVGRRALPPGHFLAVIGQSESYPVAQYETALEIARRFEVPVLEVETAELDDPAYRANGTERCYYCKRELWTRLGRLKEMRGFAAVIDGTNAEDLSDHRPGLRAATEYRVRSPLAELGWSKATVREAARALGLPNWDAPASPCLSSRIQYGLPVTADRLRQVEAAEAWLRGVGVTGNLRVRHRGPLASVEVDPDMRAVIEARWDELCARLMSLGFVTVELDPRGYRRGALLPAFPEVEP